MPRELNPDTPVGVIFRRKPVCVGRGMTIVAASQLMRLHGVGELVVTDFTDGRSVPAGIVSTRDIVTRIIATELDAAVLTAGDIVWSSPIAARTTDTVSETLRLLLAAKSNVIPLIDSDGALAGVVTLDELLLAASEQSEENEGE
jgi:CBS domain-containing protein